MVDVSVAAIKTRLEAVLATVPGITSVITSAACKLDSTNLPAIEVRPGAATRVRDGILIQRRVWELWLFVQKVNKPDNEQAILDALEACYPLLDAVPDFFHEDAPRLELNTDPLDGIHSISEVEDSGAQISPYYDGQVYSVVRYRITITV